MSAERPYEISHVAAPLHAAFDGKVPPAATGTPEERAGDVWVSDYTPSKETMHLVNTKWGAKGTSSAIFQGMSKGNGSDLFGAGGAKVGRFNGTSWTMTTPFGTAASLWSVTGTTGHMWTVGANGLVGHFQY